MTTIETPLIATSDITMWTGDEQAEFNMLVAIRQQFKEAEDTAKHNREDVDKKIEAMLLIFIAPVRLQANEWIVQRVTSSSASKLEPRKLLELGVSAATIQQATVPGKPYSYVLVSKPKATK